MANQTWRDFWNTLDHPFLDILDRDVAALIYGCKVGPSPDNPGRWRCECQEHNHPTEYPHADYADPDRIVHRYSRDGHKAQILLFDMKQRGWHLQHAAQEDNHYLVALTVPISHLRFNLMQVDATGQTLAEAICLASLLAREVSVYWGEWEDPE